MPRKCRIARACGLAVIMVIFLLGLWLALFPYSCGQALGLLILKAGGPHSLVPQGGRFEDLPHRTFEALATDAKDLPVHGLEWRSRRNGHSGGAFGWSHSFLIARTPNGTYRLDKYGHFDIGLSRDGVEGQLHALAMGTDLRKRVTVGSLVQSFRDHIRFNIGTSNCHHTTEFALRSAAPNVSILTRPNLLWQSVLDGAYDAAPNIFKPRPRPSAPPSARRLAAGTAALFALDAASSLADLWNAVDGGQNCDDIESNDPDLFIDTTLAGKNAKGKTVANRRRRRSGKGSKRPKTKSRKTMKMLKIGLGALSQVAGGGSGQSGACEFQEDNKVLEIFDLFIPGLKILRSIIMDWINGGDIPGLRGEIVWGELIVRQLAIHSCHWSGCCGNPSCALFKSYGSDCRSGHGNCGIRFQSQCSDSCRCSWCDSQAPCGGSGNLCATQGSCSDTRFASRSSEHADAKDSLMCQVQGLSYCAPDPINNPCPKKYNCDNIANDDDLRILCRIKAEGNCGPPIFSKGYGGWMDPQQPKCVASCLHDCPGRPNDLFKHKGKVYETFVCLSTDVRVGQDAINMEDDEAGDIFPLAPSDKEGGYVKTFYDLPAPWEEAVTSSGDNGRQSGMADTSSDCNFGGFICCSCMPVTFLVTTIIFYVLVPFAPIILLILCCAGA